MTIERTELPGVNVARTVIHADERGSFTRCFCARSLAGVASREIVQINHSHTRLRGTVRGMHYQPPPHTERKFVRCLRGRAWDVALDLRSDSPTFLHWHAEVLSPAEGNMLIIPEGCAHGFQALEDDTELLYLHTAYYMPSVEGGIQPTDPRVAIRWPLAITFMSERDSHHPLLGEDFLGLKL